MDDEDYGNPEVLTVKARQCNLNGFGWLEALDESKCSPIYYGEGWFTNWAGNVSVADTGPTFNGSSQEPTSKSFIQTLRSSTCIWEPLKVILAGFVESKAGVAMRDQIHCHPQNATILRS